MRRYSGLLLAAFALGLGGCGDPPAKVSGKVTCNGKPVKGSITFSPHSNDGSAMSVQLKEDGTYELLIKTVGKHNVSIVPSDIKYPAKPGEEYPCDLSPIEKELKSGPNEINIELPPPKNK